MAEDYHVHSTYSDGRFLWAMAGAAADAGLDAIGFADHCNVSRRERPRQFKKAMGFNLDRTYERRREAIDALNERSDIRIYDAVELDYDSRDEAEIRAFLAKADFEYAIGSVHSLDGTNVHWEPHFADKSPDERDRLVDEYFDRVVELIESELFEIAGHVDVIERNPALRGRATTSQYDRVAAAFVDSRTVPELNAGRVTTEYGEFHPAPAFREALHERDVPVVLGSDAHEPDDLAPRHDAFQSHLQGTTLEPATLAL